MIKFLARWFGPKPAAVDEELIARLSRLRSELMQARARDDADASGALDEIERRLESAESLAPGTAGRDDPGETKQECIRLAHELEAELCMFKPFELLYPTWTRLRQKLDRFDNEGEGRRAAWDKDIKKRISAGSDAPDVGEEHSLRQRLRQLTLELRESALRFNRRNAERAEVLRDLAKFSVWLTCGLGTIIVACLTLAACGIACEASTLALLVGTTAAGGLGALFSRTAATRDERARVEFKGLLKWDLGLRVGIGAGAALLVAAIGLSDKLLALPSESMAKAAYLVLIGFGAGFSDRFFRSMLGQAIGTRRSRPPADRT